MFSSKASKQYKKIKDQKHFNDLLNHNELRGYDLSGLNAKHWKQIEEHNRLLMISSQTSVDLSDTNLKGAKIKGVNLNGINLENANLTGIQMSGVKLREANLRGVQGEKIKMQQCDLEKADLSRSNLNGARIDTSSLDGAQLIGVQMRKAVWNGVVVSNANFTGANIAGTQFIGDHLERATFDGANMEKVVIQGLTRPKLTRANFRGANLRGAIVRRADCTGANFDGADLSGANLDGSNLTNSSMYPLSYQNDQNSPHEHLVFGYSREAINGFAPNDVMNLVRDFYGPGTNLSGASLRGTNFKNVDIHLLDEPLTGQQLRESQNAFSYDPSLDEKAKWKQMKPKFHTQQDVNDYSDGLDNDENEPKDRHYKGNVISPTELNNLRLQSQPQQRDMSIDEAMQRKNRMTQQRKRLGTGMMQRAQLQNDQIQSDVQNMSSSIQQMMNDLNDFSSHQHSHLNDNDNYHHDPSQGGNNSDQSNDENDDKKKRKKQDPNMDMK